MSEGKQVPWACSCLFPEQVWPSCRKMERTVKEGASEDGSSAIRQAYLAALQQELASLYQLMAQLDALAGHPLPTGGSMTPCPYAHCYPQQGVSATEACKPRPTHGPAGRSCWPPTAHRWDPNASGGALCRCEEISLEELVT